MHKVMCSSPFFVCLFETKSPYKKRMQTGTQRSATKTYTETTICKAVHINTAIYKTKRTEVSQKVCGSCCT